MPLLPVLAMCIATRSSGVPDCAGIAPATLCRLKRFAGCTDLSSKCFKRQSNFGGLPCLMANTLIFLVNPVNIRPITTLTTVKENRALAAGSPWCESGSPAGLPIFAPLARSEIVQFLQASALWADALTTIRVVGPNRRPQVSCGGCECF